MLTVTDEVSSGLNEVGESADVGRTQVVDRVRVVGNRVQLAVVDESSDADDDEVNIGAFGEERLTNRLQTVVRRAVRDQHHEVGHIQPVAGRKCKYLTQTHVLPAGLVWSA